MVCLWVRTQGRPLACPTDDRGQDPPHAVDRGTVMGVRLIRAPGFVQLRIGALFLTATHIGRQRKFTVWYGQRRLLFVGWGA